MEQQADKTVPRYSPRDLTASPEKLSAGGLFFGLVITISSLIMAEYGSCWVLQVSALTGGVTVITGILAMIRFRLFRRTAREWLDFQEQQQQSTSEDLFESADEAVRLAEKGEEVYVNVVVRSLTPVIGAGILLFCVLLWRNWGLTAYEQAAEPLTVAVFALTLFVGCVVFASYFIGVSREKYCRWLRPCGAWIAFSGFVLFLAGIVLLAEDMGWDIDRFDVRTAKFALILFGLLGVELILKFVSEFYRPRRQGEAEVPLYESRLLGVVTEPGGVARNVAAALNYQFGFEVSDAWFYRVLEKILLPLIVIAGVCFWLQTCIEEIGPDEKGIRTRFGAVVSSDALHSGVYAKLPWPLANIRTFPVHKVQKMPIGYRPGGEDEQNRAWQNIPEKLRGDPTARVITWNKAHNAKETNFVVPSGRKQQVGLSEVQAVKTEVSLPVSVYFIAASIPLYFKVEDLYNYFYQHEDANETLRKVAMREVTRFLAHGDFFDLLTKRREEAAEALRSKIQESANRQKLGVDVVFVGLQGMHPPVQTGEAFNKVVAAMEQKHSSVLKAQQYAIEKKPSAEAEATEIKTDAQIYREKEVLLAQAESRRFEKQLLGYRACPEVYVLRSFMELLERQTDNTRKYIMATDNAREVDILNLEQKVRPDLLDLGKKSKGK